MKQEALYYTLALLKIEGIGDIMAKKLISHCGSAQEVFQCSAEQLKKIDGVGTILIKNLANKHVFHLAQKELEYITSENIQVSYFFDDDYPEKLKHCIDAPVLLFYTGTIDWQNQKIISIVGTRQITSYGIDFCKNFIADIAPYKPIIVSGFAYGVDIWAHQCAMDFGLQTIGVLAHGLNQIYPKTHKKYVSKMEQNGGFITEFWSNTNPDKENFVKRNRIVAGIAEATLVIESADKGGSLITAAIANDYNRDVFAVPGRSTDKYSQGCNMLIKTQQAHLITSASDMVYILNWEHDAVVENKKVIQKQLFVELSSDEQKIYEYLQKNGKQLLDVIALDCEMPIFKISSILLTMELKGVIKPLPGKLFEAI
ncbi:DNA-processing protein DprA [Flavobacterium croceum]|nr:DNA-processing protein DprA [Flavobacterium croceum]